MITTMKKRSSLVRGSNTMKDVHLHLKYNLKLLIHQSNAEKFQLYFE